MTNAFGFSPRTPAYAAPEQFDVRHTAPIDSRTDQFLVGMVLFEAATGYPHPFMYAAADYLAALLTGRVDEAALARVSNVRLAPVLMPMPPPIAAPTLPHHGEGAAGAVGMQAMSLYAQHGYGKSDKLTQLSRRGTINGVILSPADEGRDALAATVRSMRREHVICLLDPQSYVYTIPNAVARMHEETQSGPRAGTLGFSTAADVEAHVDKVIAANVAQGPTDR